MNEIINFFLTINGVPQTGVSPLPTITVYDSVTNDVVLVDTTSEVGGGFYKYVMPTLLTAIDYVIVVDAGTAFPDNERYYFGEISKLNDVDAHVVWNYSTANSLDADSFGALLNQMDNATALSKTILDILLKYQKNRTKVDPFAKTLTVYDDNGSTPLKVFNLYNNDGVLDVNTVFERVPQ